MFLLLPVFLLKIHFFLSITVLTWVLYTREQTLQSGVCWIRNNKKQSDIFLQCLYEYYWLVIMFLFSFFFCTESAFWLQQNTLDLPLKLRILFWNMTHFGAQNHVDKQTSSHYVSFYKQYMHLLYGFLWTILSHEYRAVNYCLCCHLWHGVRVAPTQLVLGGGESGVGARLRGSPPRHLTARHGRPAVSHR